MANQKTQLRRRKRKQKGNVDCIDMKSAERCRLLWNKTHNLSGGSDYQQTCKLIHDATIAGFINMVRAKLIIEKHVLKWISRRQEWSHERLMLSLKRNNPSSIYNRVIFSYSDS